MRKAVIIIVTTLSVIGLIFSRFYLLDRSARFIWDESDDLVRMHNLYQNRKLTLVGPISGNNINIYGSLTYYMLMPFAVLFNFDPIGPAVGAAVYSIFSLIILAWIFSRYYRWRFWLILLLLSVIFPYLQAGRWAWNPNLVPVWQILSLSVIIMAGERATNYHWLLAGIFQGLAIHNHWYGLFSLVGFIVGLIINSIIHKKFRPVIWFVIGSFITIMPFVVFDLRHPPGLFITRMINFSPLTPKTGAFNQIVIIQRFSQLPFQFINYFFNQPLISLMFLLIFLIYCYLMLKRQDWWFKKLLLIPVIFQLIGLSLISTPVANHYFLPAVIFLILFIFIPEKDKRDLFLQKILITFFILGNLTPSIKEIYKNDWSTNIKRTRAIVDIIQANFPKNKRCNLYVPESPDSGLTGKKYRDLLLLRNVHFLDKEQYRDYNCLFVVSTSNVDRIMKSRSYELDLIRLTKPVNIWKVDDGWKVYLFII